MSTGPDERVPLLIADEPADGRRIEFFDWACGHGTTPEPITGLTVEQVGPILRAISCAISQPGSGRAHVIGSTDFIDAYIAPSYVRYGYVERADLTGTAGWFERPVIVHSAAAADVDKLLTRIADSCVDDPMPDRFNPAGRLGAYEWVVTTLTCAELATLTRHPGNAPPRLLDASVVLRELDGDVCDDDEPLETAGELRSLSSCFGGLA